MPETAAHRVLSYLRDIIELSRNTNRRDLEYQYLDAWNLAALKIYGPLPARREWKIPYHQEPASGPPPQWKINLRAKPYRKIVRRFSEVSEQGFSAEYEELQCGHIVSAVMPLPDDKPATRRRCAECAHESFNKKPISRAGVPASQKEQSA